MLTFCNTETFESGSWPFANWLSPSAGVALATDQKKNGSQSLKFTPASAWKGVWRGDGGAPTLGGTTFRDSVTGNVVVSAWVRGTTQGMYITLAGGVTSVNTANTFYLDGGFRVVVYPGAKTGGSDYAVDAHYCGAGGSASGQGRVRIANTDAGGGVFQLDTWYFVRLVLSKQDSANTRFRVEIHDGTNWLQTNGSWSTTPAYCVDNTADPSNVALAAGWAGVAMYATSGNGWVDDFTWTSLPTTSYVDPTGSNNYSGFASSHATADGPKANVDSALRAMSNYNTAMGLAETLTVAPGTYSEGSSTATPASAYLNLDMSFSPGITIQNSGADYAVNTATITGKTSGYNTYVPTGTGSGNGMTFVGITFGVDADCDNIPFATGQLTNTDMTFTDCRFIADPSRNGTTITADLNGTSAWTLTRAYIRNLSEASTVGMSFWSTSGGTPTLTMTDCDVRCFGTDQAILFSTYYGTEDTHTPALSVTISGGMFVGKRVGVFLGEDAIEGTGSGGRAAASPYYYVGLKAATVSNAAFYADGVPLCIGDGTGSTGGTVEVSNCVITCGGDGRVTYPQAVQFWARSAGVKFHGNLVVLNDLMGLTTTYAAALGINGSDHFIYGNTIVAFGGSALCNVTKGLASEQYYEDYTSDGVTIGKDASDNSSPNVIILYGNASLYNWSAACDAGSNVINNSVVFDNSSGDYGTIGGTTAGATLSSLRARWAAYDTGNALGEAANDGTSRDGSVASSGGILTVGE